jgi:hypothetical protein
MDSVGVYVDVVDVLQRPVGELVAFFLPLASEPGTTEADNPAADPKNPSRAATKSPEFIP